MKMIKNGNTEWIGDHSFSGNISTQGFLSSITTISAAISHIINNRQYTLICSASTSALTLNLPAASSNIGRIYTIKKIDNSLSAIIVDGNLSETIDGVITAGLTSQYSGMTIQSNGQQWFKIGNF
jgi:hypothetical protein